MEPAERLEQIAIAQTQAGWARLAHRMAMLLLLLCPAWWSAHALDDFLTFANGLKATNPNIETTDDNSSPWQLSGVLPGRREDGPLLRGGRVGADLAFFAVHPRLGGLFHSARQPQHALSAGAGALCADGHR